jgi:hypothetical protein
MAQRGRKSTASLGVVPVAIRQPRLPVPDALPPAVQGHFRSIVGNSPAAMFVPSDAPLIRRLAEARAWLDAPELDLQEFSRLIKIELALCRALRLVPSARVHKDAAGRMHDKARNDDMTKPWEG